MGGIREFSREDRGIQTGSYWNYVGIHRAISYRDYMGVYRDYKGMIIQGSRGYVGSRGYIESYYRDYIGSL